MKKIRETRHFQNLVLTVLEDLYEIKSFISSQRHFDAGFGFGRLINGLSHEVVDKKELADEYDVFTCEDCEEQIEDCECENEEFEEEDDEEELEKELIFLRRENVELTHNIILKKNRIDELETTLRNLIRNSDIKTSSLHGAILVARREGESIAEVYGLIPNYSKPE